MEQTPTINQYEIQKQIGSGSFGIVHLARDKGRMIAIKTETISTVKPMVSLEYQIFKELQEAEKKGQISKGKGFGFPAVFQYGQKEHFSFLVMQKLDTTLQDLVNLQLKNNIPKDIILLIMYNTLKCLQQLHSLGYLYRDVKPANFMIKTQQCLKQQGRLYMIDLGLCKQYIKDHEHIKMKVNKKMIGTPIFCSLNTHKGIQTSRRDDIQSWVYMIVYLVKKLPWEDQALRKQENKQVPQTQQSKQSSYQKIGKIKQDTNIQNLIRQEDKLPSCLIKIYQSIRHLQFQNRPNYQNYIDFIQQQYNRLTCTKTPLDQIHFRVISMIDEIKLKQRKNIKISFKIPAKKKQESKPSPQESTKDKLPQNQLKQS